MKTKPSFLTDILTAPAPDLDEGFHRVTEPLRFYSKVTGGVIEVPKGFPTDFASLRVGDLQLRGKTDRPAVLHDYLYAEGARSKIAADIIFYEACRSEGLNVFRAGIRFLAVLWSKKAKSAYQAHRKGATHATKFLREYIFKDKLSNSLNCP